ncbi:DUF2075 domain-containing protein [Streptomyces sp. NBC_01485]|uniref:DNA/RNA helicase domain-containing protein n=1 Tax=Streptomyces sp. NBC_01485 TaxID=2903884 RepID=UPI002E321CD2|nr:DNA/RNA helicase domain-containing protein [Streptomyces sp. NBC_01485]
MPLTKLASPKVDDLLDAARVTVFLLDRSQVVRPNEVGTVELIQEATKNRLITPRKYELDKQFRCGGSDRYRDWVHDLLGISSREPDSWIPDGLMHVEVADCPSIGVSVKGEQAQRSAVRTAMRHCFWTSAATMAPSRTVYVPANN